MAASAGQNVPTTPETSTGGSQNDRTSQSPAPNRLGVMIWAVLHAPVGRSVPAHIRHMWASRVAAQTGYGRAVGRNSPTMWGHRSPSEFGFGGHSMRMDGDVEFAMMA